MEGCGFLAPKPPDVKIASKQCVTPMPAILLLWNPSRPLVISAESTVEIAVHPGSLKQIRVSCDGQEDLGLVNGGRIILRKHARKVHLIHPPRYRYFDILRAKLRWGGTNFS